MKIKTKAVYVVVDLRYCKPVVVYDTEKNAKEYIGTNTKDFFCAKTPLVSTLEDMR